jgi:FK506-binding protein 4/5
MKEYNKKEAKFYGNMFAKMSKVGSLESNVSMQPKLITSNCYNAQVLYTKTAFCLYDV